MRWLVICLTCLLLAVWSAGCSNNTEGTDKSQTADTNQKPADVTQKPPAEIKPANLTVFSKVPITDTDFQVLFVDSMKAKYPQITLNLIRDGKGTAIGDLIAAGTIPDLVITWNGGIGDFYQYDLVDNLSPLIKSNNMDTSRFDKNVLDSVTNEEGIQAIPMAVQLYALYYNKDIFDKYGVPYPRDGMTWDDTIELARKVTRTEGEINYRGLDPGHIGRIKLFRSLAVVDPKTQKAAVNNDQWKQAFELLHRIYSIPGNAPADVSGGAFKLDFEKVRIVAMMPAWNILSEIADLPPDSLNWDMAQNPSFKETPNTYAAVDTHVVFLAKTSKNKEAAFKVLETLVSVEVQMQSAMKTGRLTPLVKDEIRNELKEYPIVKGKNIQGVLKSHPAPAPHYTKYEVPGERILKEGFTDYFDKGKDLNTALRETEEKVNGYIESNK